MARIRSIHPGLRTDENFMVLSFPARDLLISLWMEADDHGLFPWKPVTLKARIFPADSLNIDLLLEELANKNWIKAYLVDGVPYGACRNFLKWQRPRTPSYVYPLPAELNDYIGLEKISVEKDPVKPASLSQNAEMSDAKEPTLSQNVEMPPQREEGGGMMEDEGGNKNNPPTEGGALSQAVDAYNLVASQIDLPQCQRLSKTRRDKLAKRLADCGGLEGWESVLAKLRASDFCQGKNDRGWKADFDFLMQEKSFTRLLEGFYDTRKAHNGKQSAATHLSALASVFGAKPMGTDAASPADPGRTIDGDCRVVGNDQASDRPAIRSSVGGSN